MNLAIENKYNEKAIINIQEDGYIQATSLESGTTFEITKTQLKNKTWRCPEVKKRKKEKLDLLKQQHKDREKEVKKLLTSHAFDITLDKLEGYAIALDQSQNHSGVIIIDLSNKMPVEYESFQQYEELDFIVSANKIAGRLQYYISKYKPEFVTLENTYLDKKFGSPEVFEKLSYIKNRLIALCYQNSTKVTTIMSPHWKREYKITGKTYKARKECSLKEIKKYLPEAIVQYFDDDLADAYFIMLYTLNNRVKLEKSQNSFESLKEWDFELNEKIKEAKFELHGKSA